MSKITEHKFESIYKVITKRNYWHFVTIIENTAMPEIIKWLNRETHQTIPQHVWQEFGGESNLEFIEGEFLNSKGYKNILQ